MSDTDPISTADKVYHSLRADMLSLKYRPGVALSRPQLARGLGTSQTPVREALLRLEQEGFVRVKPQAGTVVAPISLVAVHQAQFLKRSLAEAVVRRLAARSKQQDMRSLKAEHLDASGTQEADQIFLAKLFEAAGMGALLDRVLPLMTPLERCNALREWDENSQGRRRREHRDVLDRIEKADADGAALAMSAHLATALADLDALRRAEPDVFSD